MPITAAMMAVPRSVLPTSLTNERSTLIASSGKRCRWLSDE
jgi:hypothetical protein